MPRGDPPAVEIAAGEVLHRVHAAINDARYYGRRDGAWRWDDPARKYGVLYAGRTQAGPFAETLLRQPGQRAILWSEIEKRRFAVFRALAPLRLADMHGAGLAWYGTTAAKISADHDGSTYPGAYADCQAISAMVYADTELDGIEYRSRFDTDHLCVALFDRADTKLELVRQGDVIDRSWVEKLLKRQGRHVVDL